MAKVLEINRCFYYKNKKRCLGKRKTEDKMIGDNIKEIFKKRYKRYGSPRIKDDLKDIGINCSKKRVARLMKEQNLVAKAKKKFVATTDSKHNEPVSPNLLDRNFNIEAPNWVWCSDLTYIRTREGWLYLCVIIDLFSRKVVGWSMDDNMKTEVFTRALEMAYKTRKPQDGLLFHSDRGSQYCSKEFRGKLESYNMIQSMSRKGNCWDNAVAESFFHTLKVEEVYGKIYETREEAKSCVFEYIEVFYNRVRRHYHLNCLSPLDFEKINEEKSLIKAA